MKKELKELKLTKNVIIPFPNFQQNTIISPTQMNDNFEEIEYAYNNLIDNHNGAIQKIQDAIQELKDTWNDLENGDNDNSDNNSDCEEIRETLQNHINNHPIPVLKTINGQSLIGSGDITIKGDSSNDVVGGNSIDAFSSKLQGKKLSIMGDSISTFAGYTYPGNRNRYPQSNLITDVNLQYWKKLLDKTGMVLGINDSWAGSMVANTSSTDSGDVGPNRCMASTTRVKRLGENGDPDVILIYGGTNDCARGINIGTFDTSSPKGLTESQLSALPVNTWASAMRTMILKMQYYYPNATIFVVGLTYPSTYFSYDNGYLYNKMTEEICTYLGVHFIDLRKCGMSALRIAEYLPDGIHPGEKGLDMMYRFIYNEVMSKCGVPELSLGEGTVPPSQLYPCTSLTLDKSSLTITERVNHQLLATITPSNCTDVVEWVSSSPNVILVNEGTLIPLSNGTSTITATCGDFVKTCEVTVDLGSPCTSLTLTPQRLEFTEKATQQLTVNITPERCLDALIWSMSNDGIVSIDESGLVRPLKNGTSTITATCGAFTQSCEVVVDMPLLRETNNSHAQDLPLGFTSDTNLWEELTPEDVYYGSSSWTKSGLIGSITFAVVEGDKIDAYSFKSKAHTGGSSDGIRVTYFNDDAVVKSIAPASVYSEYSQNGYLTIPSGVNAISVPMWNISNSNNYVNLYKVEGDVLVPCTSLTIDPTTLVFDGTSEPQTINTIVEPSNCNESISWSVDDDTVAIVEKGVVTPIKNGTCTVTVTCGAFTQTCNITVSNLLEPVWYIDEAVTHPGDKIANVANGGWRYNDGQQVLLQNKAINAIKVYSASSGVLKLYRMNKSTKETTLIEALTLSGDLAKTPEIIKLSKSVILTSDEYLVIGEPNSEGKFYFCSSKGLGFYSKVPSNETFNGGLSLSISVGRIQ